MLPFICPRCGLALSLKDDLADKKVRCPRCRQVAQAPGRPPQVETALLPRPAPANFLATQDGQQLGSHETLASQPPSPAQAGDPLAPAQQPGEIGRLGSYRVLTVLGRGAMGIVYLGEDTQLDRPVALKVMLPDQAASPAARQRFLREARAAAAVRHDNVVTIFQVGQDRDVPFLAMELLQGQTLAQRLQGNGPLPVPEVLRIGREVAAGLGAAHQKGLIHRDVKPANLWLEDGTDRVKILDFGLARTGDDTSQVTQSGAIVGTPAFMAPEQARGEAVDGRSDLFSLGCVLYRLCTGRLPFVGKDPLSTLMAAANQQPSPPRERNPDVPAALSDLVLRLLAKTPEERPASAAEVVEALKRVEQQGAAPSSSSPPVPGPQETTAPLGPARPRHAGRRWRSVAVAAGIALLGLLAAIVVIRMQTGTGTLVVEVDDPAIEVTVKQGGVRVVDRKKERTFELSARDGEVEFFDPDGGVRLLTKQFRLERGGRVVVDARHELAEARTKPPVVKEGPPKRPPANPSPFDALRREDVPRYELEVAGGGDPARAPAELVAIFGDSRLKHWWTVSGVVFSPDGKWLASCGWDGAVKLWDTATGKEARTFQRHGVALHSVAFAPDSKTLAVDGPLATVELWDVASGKQVRSINTGQEWVASLAFSPDGQTLAVGAIEAPVKLFRVATGEERHALALGGWCWSVAISPDGKTLAAATDRQGTRLWEVSSGKELRTLGVPGNNSYLAFCLDGQKLATSGLDGTLRLWDLKTGKGEQVWQLGPPAGHVRQVLCAPDGRHLVAVNGNGTVYVLRLAALAKTGEKPPAVDYDRTMAEWVLNRGGNIKIASATVPEGIPIQGKEDLPKEHFRLQFVDMGPAKVRMSDADLDRFAKLKSLRELVIWYHPITDAGLARLRGMAALELLQIGHTQVTGAGLVHLKDLPKLRRLGLNGLPISTGLVHLSTLTQLEVLALDGVDITDEGLRQLKPLKKLHWIVLQQTKISDKGLQQLELPELEFIDLNGTKVTDDGLRHLKKSPNLETLKVTLTQVTDDGLKHLVGLSKLRELHLGHLQVTDAGLEHLMGLKNLRILELRGTRVTEAGVKRLKAAFPGCDILH